MILLIAPTYRIASHLPTVLLDGLINLPYFLISIRNRLLPVQPFRAPLANVPPPVASKRTKAPKDEAPAPEKTPESSDFETNSDADVESNIGDAAESSWVSLNNKHADA